LRHLADEGDVRHFFRIHNDFHELFLRAADNEKLSELVTNLVRKFQRLRYASLSLPGRMHISVKEHERIIEAFQSRNADMAETLVRKNAEYGGRVLMQETDGAPPLKPAEQAAALQLDI
jgi:DNA-binding GntR family transcriptional regulator